MLKAVALIVVIAAGVALGAAYKYRLILDPSPSEPVLETSVYDFTLRDIDGVPVSLSKFKGSVLMIVNTASKCGYTPQYEGLQAIYEKYRDSGFVVLGFPANNFMGQEPGTEAEIKEFCTTRYKVTFPMFAKISVKGEDQHPLYNFLTNPKTDPQFAGEITWNFNKFLIDRQGRVIARFSTKEKPDSEAITEAIERALGGLKPPGPARPDAQ
ncbi:MAG: glutathione peroxidase [Acidobacteria bacterium]|nr:glutathione peroxidase [Acidobacteriota bacterium]MCW5950506.1 glutathione peroxidase [Pyrinomonadaceae bacterium]